MTFSRREFLKAGLAGSLAVGAGGLLSACGTGNTIKAFTTSTTGKPRYGGTLRAGLTGGSTADTLDPLSAVTNVDFSRIDNLYEPLIGLTPDAKPVYVLAEEVTPNAKATEWTIRVKQGITFHNGKTLTADDVIYTFQQILNPKTPGSAAAGLASVDAKGMTKLDAYTARIPCSTPFATLAEALAIPGYSDIIPVGYDLAAPAGTGPFKVKSFSPGTQSTFVRYDGYWQSGLPYLDEIVITDYSDQTSQVNALLAGQVDVVNLLSADVISEVQGEGKNILLSTGGGWNPFTMRVDTGTFSDVRIRQAMRLVVDRQQILDLVFGGFGTVGNDLFGIWAPEYDHSLPQRHQDIDQARSLLKAAGAEDLHVTLVTSDIAQGTVLAAQVFAQQASQAGVTVNVEDVTVDEFYGTNYLKWQFAQDYWFYNFYLPQVSLATLPTASFNETHWDNSRYNSLYAQAIATTDTSLSIELAHEMQQIEYNEGGYIIPFFPPVIDGFGANVGGLVPSKSGLSLGAYDFKNVWLS
ncbi:MAG TPA: ABC transporter substrate-binding protein [Streptosporangiaceae bacterium]|nr:ABC transporter substrate-binding protein [Streptosporangiaceae bacterium]